MDKVLPNNAVSLGYLAACIGGDTRYTDTLRVSWLPDDGTVAIVVTESSPSGGRDSLTSSSQFGGTRVDVKDPTPAGVLQAVKRLIDDGRYCFKRYGKPTKNFRWETGTGTATGLSASLVKRALDEARSSVEAGQ